MPDWLVPLSSVSVGEREVASVVEALGRREVSGTVSDTKRFQEALSEVTGRKHVLAMNSGTSALEIALGALEVGPGDEVIVPALTFAAPASAILHRGAKVVLCDVRPDSWTLDAEACALAITPRTKAIISVDVFGQPCDYGALMSLGPTIVQDAAEAHGATYAGKACGAHGHVSVMSFHANKTVSVGEGGALLTDTDELARKARSLMAHGVRPGGGYVHVVAGHNARMANLVAAFGVGQLSRWRELVERRNQVAASYRQLLAGLP